MARAYGSRAQMALAFESVYGTAPGSGFKRMPFASTTLSAEQALIDNELLGYGRDPLAPIKDAVVADGEAVVSVDVEGIGYWLKALLGAPVTTGTTPKTHTFNSGGLTIPSMSIEIGMPEVPSFAMNKGVVANSLRIEATRRGQLQATVGLVSQGEVKAASSAAGTITDFVVQRFGHFNGAIKREGVLLSNITSAEFTYSNNVDRVETIRSDGLIDGADPTIASMGGRLVSRFADTVLLDQAISGAPCSLEFSWTISATLSLTITAHAVYLPVPRRSITGPGGIEVAFDWQAAKAQSPARMVTAVLVNAVAGY